VIDEASSFKNHGSKRFKALRKVRGNIDRVIELTGTPAGNGLLDLWPQVFLLDGGERLGKTYTKYRDTYFDSDYMGFKWTPKPDAEAAIHAKLADIVLRLDAADYLKLPPFLPHTIEVELPPSARVHYRELEREYLTQIEGTDIAIAHAAALSNKLLQCANGTIYTNEERDTAHLHDAKIDALDGIVAEHPGRPVLVAYSYRTDIPRLRERFPHAVLLDDNPETIARWNRGEIEMLLTHPASAGHGLNLQDGGNIVVWFGVTWSLELYQQFNARLRRQGQQAAVVLLYHITAADTVDGTVLASLARKNTTQGALLDALKTDIRERLAAWHAHD
jgi:SNF2 family DNA or RNA helicase